MFSPKILDKTLTIEFGEAYLMEENMDFTERRQHGRTSVQNLVVGILNSDEPVIIGSINDISMGGVKYTYEFRMAPDDNPIHSIDLIAYDHCLIDIPCIYAWDIALEMGPDSQLKDIKQCGIKFGELTPNQTFLLRSLIERCTSLEMKGFSATPHINYNYS